MNIIPIKIAGHLHTFSLQISFKLDEVIDLVLNLPDHGTLLSYPFLKKPLKIVHRTV
jgi:hypothetical protein